ncbi:MAG: hypothetical protein SFW36_00915 [Leptolyngbyaceae cyanobacterium bins.59]|nr:hypothetical protein [Leptolyngbyaceae cyanobacterium bins.59]
MRKLKRLPWGLVFQVAIVINLIILIGEALILAGAEFSPAVRHAVEVLYVRPPFAPLTPIVIGLGVGALAVWIAERFFRQLYLNLSTLWALYGSLVLLFLIKTVFLMIFPAFLPVLADFNGSTLTGLVLGIFWKGRSHYR